MIRGLDQHTNTPADRQSKGRGARKKSKEKMPPREDLLDEDRVSRLLKEPGRHNPEFRELLQDAEADLGLIVQEFVDPEKAKSIAESDKSADLLQLLQTMWGDNERDPRLCGRCFARRGPARH